MEVQFCISCQESINQSPILDHQCPEPVCLECEQSWLKSRIEDGYPLQCICGFPLTENEIKGFLSVATSNVDLEQLKSAYEKYMERRDPNIIFCPTVDCDGKIRRCETIDKTHMHCPKCQKISCILCKLFHQPGRSCEEAETDSNYYKSEEDRASEEYKLLNSCQCPKCKTHIQRAGGCYHMHCSSCDFHFCILCLEEHRVGHAEKHYREIFEHVSNNRLPEEEMVKKMSPIMQRVYFGYRKYLLVQKLVVRSSVVDQMAKKFALVIGEDFSSNNTMQLQNAVLLRQMQLLMMHRNLHFLRTQIPNQLTPSRSVQSPFRNEEDYTISVLSQSRTDPRIQTQSTQGTVNQSPVQDVIPIVQDTPNGIMKLISPIFMRVASLSTPLIPIYTSEVQLPHDIKPKELKDDTYTTIELQNKKIKYSMNKSKAEASLGDVLVSDTPTFEWRVFQRISVTAYGSENIYVNSHLRNCNIKLHITKHEGIMRCDVLANNWTIVARDKKNGNCIRTRGSNRYATRISLSGPQVGKNKEEECPIIINMGISDQPADCRNFARITAGDVEYFIFDATKKPQHADWTTTFKWIDNGQKSKFAWAQTWVLMDMLNKQPPQGARGDDNPNKNLVVDSVYNGGNVSLNNHQLRSYRMNIEGEINVRHQLQKIIPETVVFDKLTLMEPSRDVFVNIVPSDLGNSSQQTKVWAIRESSFNKMLMHLQQLKMEQVQRTKAQTNGARATEIQDLLVSEEPPQKKMRQN